MSSSINDCKCSVNDCQNKSYAKKLCSKHYSLKRKWGAILNKEARKREKTKIYSEIMKKCWQKYDSEKKDKILKNILSSSISSLDISKKLQGKKAGIENKTSIYVGVSYRTGSALRFWAAQIKFQKKLYYLGTYPTEDEAALAYNRKARELYGENAKVNKINLKRL